MPQRALTLKPQKPRKGTPQNPPPGCAGVHRGRGGHPGGAGPEGHRALRRPSGCGQEDRAQARLRAAPRRGRELARIRHACMLLAPDFLHRCSAALCTPHTWDKATTGTLAAGSEFSGRLCFLRMLYNHLSSGSLGRCARARPAGNCMSWPAQGLTCTLYAETQRPWSADRQVWRRWARWWWASTGT